MRQKINKKAVPIILTLLLILGWENAHAQNAPITITEQQALNFGLLIADTAASSATVTTNNKINTTGTTIATGGHSRAEFRLTGERRAAFTVSISSPNTLSGAGANMTLDNMTNSIGTTGSFKGNGTQDMDVGGRLNINAGQLGGTYSGTYIVTINYQ